MTRAGVRMVIFVSTILFLVLWVIIPTLRVDSKKPEYIYTIREYNEDMGAMYYSLGLHAQGRNDFKQALKFYALSLKNNPKQDKVLAAINLCRRYISRV
jgi:hypothetical protein